MSYIRNRINHLFVHTLNIKGEKRMFYRIGQFIKAVTAKVTTEDLNFVKQYLNEKELELFFKLKLYEQRHCIDVANQLRIMTLEDAEMIKLGLLHDIGKIRYPLHPIEKSVIVVLDRLTAGRIKKYNKYKIVKCYYEHPQIGYDLLQTLGTYEEGFLKLVQKHHQKENNPKLLLLQQADNLS